MKYTKIKIPLLGSAQNEYMVKGLEAIEDVFIGATTDTPIRKRGLYYDIMRHRVALCKTLTIHLVTRVWIKVVTRKSASIV